MDSVARVSEVAAEDIEPTSHALPLTNVFRDDVLRPSLPREQVLAGAPASELTGSGSPHPRGGGVNAIIRATAVDLAAKIKSRELARSRSPVPTCSGSRRSIRRCTPFCTSTVSAARRDAHRRQDRERGAGRTARRCPLALKDVLTYAGAPTTCGSKILAGWIPPYNATVTQRLLDADLVILGKTNMDEFAMGSSTENSAYGPTHNPWAGPYSGRLGGGSAASLAAFEVPLAIGTDTGGSIRQPAAVTGTVGVKPTRWHVSLRARGAGLEFGSAGSVRAHGP